MPYEADLSPRAADQIRRLDFNVQRVVLEHLDELCASPTKFSRPSYFPYLPGFQLYEFQYEAFDAIHYFRVLFKYAADEQHLWIHGIGHQVVERS